MADRDVTLKLNVSPQTERAQAALKSLAADLSRGQEGLDKLNMAMNPAVLEKRVRVQRQLAEAQEAYKKAAAAEAARQDKEEGKGGAGLFGGGGWGKGLNLAGMVPGGNALAGLLGGGGGALAVGGPVGALAAGALEAGKALMAFTAKANPAVMERFQFAVDDAQAVLGQRFAPVVQLMTEGVRALGDFLANALPSTQEVRAALNELKPAMNEVKEALSGIAPVIKTGLSVGLKALAFEFQMAAAVLKPVTWLLKQFGDLLGAGTKSSMGAAARPAQQFGDFNAFMEENNRLALSGAGVEDQQLVALNEISGKVSDILQALGASAQTARTAGKIAEEAAVGGALGPFAGLYWAHQAIHGLLGM